MFQKKKKIIIKIRVHNLCMFQPIGLNNYKIFGVIHKLRNAVNRRSRQCREIFLYFIKNHARTTIGSSLMRKFNSAPNSIKIDIFSAERTRSSKRISKYTYKSCIYQDIVIIIRTIRSIDENAICTLCIIYLYTHCVGAVDESGLPSKTKFLFARENLVDELSVEHGYLRLVLSQLL